MSEIWELFVCQGCHQMCRIGIKNKTLSVGQDDSATTTKVIRLTQNGRIVYNYLNKSGKWQHAAIVSVRDAKNVANLFTANCAYFRKNEKTR